MGSENGHRRGLLVDYGGVLTSSPFASFRQFCTAEGLDENAILTRLRADASARELVMALETGALPEPDFEARFAAMLGVAPDGLIDRLFAHYEPDEPMLAAVARARASGIRTGLISNSWGTRRYDRALLAELFDGVVISGEVGMRKPAPEIYRLGAERAGARPRGLRVRRRHACQPRPRGAHSGWRPSITSAPTRRSSSSRRCSGCRCDETTRGRGGRAGRRGDRRVRRERPAVQYRPAQPGDADLCAHGQADRPHQVPQRPPPGPRCSCARGSPR